MIEMDEKILKEHMARSRFHRHMAALFYWFECADLDEKDEMEDLLGQFLDTIHEDFEQTPADEEDMR